MTHAPTSTTRYTPRPGSLPALVIGFFRDNPDETLTRADIATKFGHAQSSIATGLRCAVRAGCLTLTATPAGKPLYCGGGSQTPEPKASAAKPCGVDIDRAYRARPGATAKRRKTYLAGPMTGLPGYNYAAFAATAAALRAQGRTVVSPAENGLPPGALWHEHMRADIKELVGCDMIYLLPGWSTSKGARLEWAIALHLGMAIEGSEV